MLKRLFYYAALSTYAVATFLIILITYWYVRPYDIIDFHQPVDVIPDVVYTGQLVSYYMDSCKHFPLPATLTKEYIDGVVYATPPLIVNNPVGCRKFIAYTLVPNLPEGQYRLRFSFQYHPNPVREIDLQIESELFTIKQATKSGGI